MSTTPIAYRHYMVEIAIPINVCDQDFHPDALHEHLEWIVANANPQEVSTITDLHIVEVHRANSEE
jgi:hypothetical protein